jgi:hypothetical protein
MLIVGSCGRYVQGRVHHQALSSKGLSEKASETRRRRTAGQKMSMHPTVVGVDEGVE